MHETINFYVTVRFALSEKLAFKTPNDRRYGAIEISDKYGLPTVTTFVWKWFSLCYNNDYLVYNRLPNIFSKPNYALWYSALSVFNPWSFLKRYRPQGTLFLKKNAVLNRPNASYCSHIVLKERLRKGHGHGLKTNQALLFGKITGRSTRYQKQNSPQLQIRPSSIYLSSPGPSLIFNCNIFYTNWERDEII